MEWYLKVLRNYVKFEGRARRKEYWMYALIGAIISIALGIIEILINAPDLFTGLYALAVLLPSLAVCSRRLHDTGRSGYWLFLGLIPLIGAIILLVFMCEDSESGDNQYGENPKTTG